MYNLYLVSGVQHCDLIDIYIVLRPPQVLLPSVTPWHYYNTPDYSSAWVWFFNSYNAEEGQVVRLCLSESKGLIKKRKLEES